MEYFLFTFPNCSQCDQLKHYLPETDIEFEEYSLVRKEGKLKIREFLSHLKRDDKGAIIVPTLIAQDEGNVMGVFNSRQELEDWLKSKE